VIDTSNVEIVENTNNSGEVGAPQDNKGTNINIEEKENIKLLLTEENKIVEMPFDDYLIGVLIGEVPSTYELEAIKAQAIVARTYTMHKLKYNPSAHEGADMCDDINCCQCFKTKEYAFASWDDAEENAKWAKLSEACLGCGTCTFVCPTCQCYDIRDFDTGHGIDRFRCWDSCMYSDFTKMAHGNPRLSQKERFRQRFMHKLVYYPENNEGIFGCVGCGRCVEKCPISMNIVKVMRTLAKEDEE
jgi:heterodisulfide reductase subunit C